MNMNNLPKSKLMTSEQSKQWGAQWTDERGNRYALTATVRHDDTCRNGHNSFGITGDLRCNGREDSGGMLHDEIAARIPELVPFLKWHLTGTDGPMHYIANARYWAGHSGFKDGKTNSPPNEQHLKSTIVFGAVPQWDDGRDPMAMTDNDLQEWLKARLPDLMVEFKTAVETLGFTY